jgi:hypothetical protein
MVQNVLSNKSNTDKKPTGNFSTVVNVYASHFMDTATYHNKNFNRISVQKYISFVITNFITSFLDNLREINNLQGAISAVKPKKFEGKKGWTDKM